jgi:hypothetical protein
MLGITQISPAFLWKESLFVTGSIQVKDGRANYFAVLNAYNESGKRKLKWVDIVIKY